MVVCPTRVDAMTDGPSPHLLLQVIIALRLIRVRSLTIPAKLGQILAPTHKVPVLS